MLHNSAACPARRVLQRGGDGTAASLSNDHVPASYWEGVPVRVLPSAPGRCGLRPTRYDRTRCGQSDSGGSEGLMIDRPIRPIVIASSADIQPCAT